MMARRVGERTPAVTRAPRAAWVAWIAVCVIWGTTYLGIRVSLETIPPVLMSGIRWTIAGLLVAAVLLARGQAAARASRLARSRVAERADDWYWERLRRLGRAVRAQRADRGRPCHVAFLDGRGRGAHFGAARRLTRGTISGLLVGFGGILLLVWPDLHDRRSRCGAIRDGADRPAARLCGVGPGIRLVEAARNGRQCVRRDRSPDVLRRRADARARHRARRVAVRSRFPRERRSRSST